MAFPPPVPPRRPPAPSEGASGSSSSKAAEPKPVVPGSSPKLRPALPLPSGKTAAGTRPIAPPPKNVVPPQHAIEQPETLTTPFAPQRAPLTTEIDEEVETLVKALDPVGEPPTIAKPPPPPQPERPAEIATFADVEPTDEAPTMVRPLIEEVVAKPPEPKPIAKIELAKKPAKITMPGPPPTPPPPAPVSAAVAAAFTPEALGLPMLTPPKALAPLAVPQPSTHLLLEEGKIIAGKYKLDKPAGFGGMAQLWVATNASTAAEVCIKILVPDSSDEEATERFRREAYAAARLSHRAIVRIFDLVELDENGVVVKTGKPHALAIVMELLKGETLGDLLMKKEKLPLEQALDIFLPVLSALGHAHRAGVVHRDLKPDNIFLATDPDGVVGPKVLDFGVSKVAGTGNTKNPLTLDGVMLGTPSFMSPEQARGARNIDERSDVFSAGIVFYMMLTGKNPFEDDTFHSVVQAIIDRDPLPIPGLAPEVWAVVAKALAKDPQDRFNDATELSIELRKASGRKIVTESGNHLVSPSARMSAARPPHDSQASVPPVGSNSLSPADPMPSLPPAGVPTPGRQRALKIVGAVVGLATLLLAVAIVRSVIAKPDNPAEPSARVVAITSPPPTATPTPTPTPSPTPTPTPTVTSEGTSQVELPASSASGAPAASAAPKKRVVPKPGESAKPGEEPKNASVPGF